MKTDKEYGVDAGKLRHLVNVEAFTQTSTDTLGKRVGAWTAILSNVPASVETMLGREAEIAHQIVASADFKITMRYQSTVTVKTRIKFGTRIFNIIKVDNVKQQNRKLILTCTEQQ